MIVRRYFGFSFLFEQRQNAEDFEHRTNAPELLHLMQFIVHIFYMIVLIKQELVN